MLGHSGSVMMERVISVGVSKGVILLGVRHFIDRVVVLGVVVMVMMYVNRM